MYLCSVVVVVVVHNVQTSSPLKPLGKSKPTFMRKGKVELKLVYMLRGPGYMTKMATSAINSKHLKNLFPTKLTDFNETWYVILGTLAHHSLYKSRSLIGHDLFYGNVKFGHICFSMGNNVNIGYLLFGSPGSNWDFFFALDFQ